MMSNSKGSKFAFVDASGHRVAASRHLNPDGTLGGWVARNARVGAGAVVEPGALVAPRAVVPPRQRVKRGERVLAPR